MKQKFIVPALLVLLVLFFSYPIFIRAKLPIPSDTIIGLYHPFRDLYAKQYPNGIPYKNFLITDPVRQQYPWRFLAISIEKDMQLPLWNPYSFAGAPLLANFQTAAFYPFNILLFVLPFAFGWSALIILGQILAGVFMYLYLTNLRLNYYSRFLGSIVYVFCGFMIAWLEWGTLDQVGIWLPLILFSLDKLVFYNKKQRVIIKNIWGWIFLLSLVLSFFAGHVQSFFYLFIVSFCYFLARWFQHGKSRKLLLLFSILICCFLIFTIIQWFPTLQFIALSARNVDQLNNWQQPGWFIPWQNLIQFIVPDFFGNPATLNYWGIWNYAEFIGYIGIFPLLIAFFALFYRHDKKTLFFGTFFFLSLIFALPTIFAKIPYLLQISFFATSQPTRLLFITDFSLAILAALGLDYFIRFEMKKKLFYPIIYLFILFAGIWVFVLFGYKLLHISPENISISKHNLYIPTLFFALTVVFIGAAMFIKEKKVTKIFIVILLALSVIDLFRFADKFIPFTDRHYLFPVTATLSYLQQQPGQFRIMTTDSQMLPPNFSIMYHLQSLDGYDPLYLQRYGEMMAAISRDKPDISAPFGFNRIITPTNINSRLIDLFGVKYVLSLSSINKSKLVKVFTEGQTQVYENKNAFSRTFFVNDIKSATTKKEAIGFMFAKNIDLHKTAIVEGWDKSATHFTIGSATINNYQENSVSIKTQSKGDSFLVLTDSYYPNWHVTIDGNKVKIYQTDYNFRGIFLPRGNHDVVFFDSLL
ncbi:MAG TPA: YfhO family protein [Candidatus Sulfotelmatobacter sp.]|jgi:hypothetical protein|nr:YfhO family protein [Candidatus Sulfotelmatobacter sp.]